MIVWNEGRARVERVAPRQVRIGMAAAPAQVRGGCNASQLRRRLLYVTFGVPYCRPEGSTYSILEEHAQRRLKLRDYRDFVTAAA